MLENLTRAALWSGVPYKDIGALTPADIAAVQEAETEKHKDFYRMMAWLFYTGAYLTAVGVNAPKKFPSIEEAFPTLFEEKEQQSWWVMKERVEQYSKMKKQL